MIHATAIIDPSAKLAADVSVGPYSVIGPEVEIGAGTTVGSNALIAKNTKIGKGNIIYSYASLGNDSQDLKYKGGEAWLHIGDHNTFREFCTINRGSGGSDITLIGDHNLFMSYTHVAHDCRVGNYVVFSNLATLAGHIQVDDYAIIGGGAVVHQFCNIGAHSFIGGAAGLGQDAMPYVIFHGVPAYPISVNLVGLRRHGFSESAIEHIRHAYRILFRRGNKLEDAREELIKMVPACPEIQLMIDAIDRSQRGIARRSRSSKEESAQ